MLLRNCGPRNSRGSKGFNGHPPLGVNATMQANELLQSDFDVFQQAPTLGVNPTQRPYLATALLRLPLFQRAPTLGGECYWMTRTLASVRLPWLFQWAPTLGG